MFQSFFDKDNRLKQKKGAISDRAAGIILNDLIDSVSSPEGYANSLYHSKHVLAAKTGTDEIKEKQDTLGTENSFMLFFAVQNEQFRGMILSEDARRNGTAIDKASALVTYLEEIFTS